MVEIAEHKCMTCKYFDIGDNECTKGRIHLNLLGEYQVVSQCYAWEEKKNEIH